MGTLWRSVIAEIKAQKRDMLAGALAHGRVLSLSGGRLRLGYGPQDGMYRRQAERQQRDAEAALSKVLGAPTGLIFELTTAQEATQSIAEEDSERAKERENRVLRESREHPAVLSAMKHLQGTVEHIKVLEVEETPDFSPAPDEREDE